MVNLFIGIDIGTQGVRVVLVDDQGHVITSASQVFPLNEKAREEQSPDYWWSTSTMLIGRMLNQLPLALDRSAILAISVTSTSGTVIPMGFDNRPIHNALMYSDPRSKQEGEKCRALAEIHVPGGYTGFNASSGLSKILWFVNNHSNKVAHIRKWIHASDYITGMLCGNFDTTDYTNALKSGFDVERCEWPAYITASLPIVKSWLQDVVPSGTPIGSLDRGLASQWGLPIIPVVVGLTDGCASQVASGAVKPGDWNTTIGTTLVIKGVTKRRVIDKQGRLYSHRHPEGYWMPGGASNTGADWISTDFRGDLDRLNRQAEACIPTGYAAWPLKQLGERFPFVATHARGFEPDGLSDDLRYASFLEGVAYIERMCYALVEECSGETVKSVYTAGGGSNSDVWLKIRSSVLNLPIYKCYETSGAVGAAIIAASKTFFSSLSEATQMMTRVEKVIDPDHELVGAYESGYHQFIHELKTKKYI